MSKNFDQSILENQFQQSDLDLSLVSKGKVREIYQITDDQLLLVTSDRVSAFDRVLGAVPYKGQVLNQLTAWWLNIAGDLITNHLVSMPDPNAMLVKKAEPFTVEVIVRGYITGVTKTALWYRYNLGEREIYGHQFPEGLEKNQKLPEPIITPTTKGGPTGHDERLTVAEVVTGGYLDKATWDTVQNAALELFKRGQEIASKAGLILVDTKYEFGRLPNGEIALIDEVHTPDSSRYWIKDSYEKHLTDGLEPQNYDKEFLRLQYAEKGYRGDGEPPEMDDELWINVSKRYIDLYERLTGTPFAYGDYPVAPRLQANLVDASLL